MTPTTIPATNAPTTQLEQQEQQGEGDASSSSYVLESFPSFDTAVDEFFARLEAQKLKQVRAPVAPCEERRCACLLVLFHLFYHLCVCVLDWVT